MPRGLVAMARIGGHCPLRVSGGILCSERGQSRDAFQAIQLEETSPRCNQCLKYYHCMSKGKRQELSLHIESVPYLL